MRFARCFAAPLLILALPCPPALGQLLIESDGPPPGPAASGPLDELLSGDLTAAEVVPAPPPSQIQQQPPRQNSPWSLPVPTGSRRGKGPLASIFASEPLRPGSHGGGRLLGEQPLANPWNHPSGSSWGYGMLAPKPHRFFGLGGPLSETSWLNRPYHFDLFMGAMFGSRLIRGRLKQGNEIFGGYRFGSEINHYWGWEARLALTSLPLYDSQNAVPVRSNNIVLWDMNCLYYPWGDARWRPYFGMGLGFASLDFSDEMGLPIKETLFAVPWGFGLKYRWKDWIVLRADLTDNMALSGTLTTTQHNVSLTFGIEARLGGGRRNYWPWNPSQYLW